jgi:hypothetical protein
VASCVPYHRGLHSFAFKNKMYGWDVCDRPPGLKVSVVYSVFEGDFVGGGAI